MKILVLGAQGQVGSELLNSCKPLGQVIPVTREKIDFSEPERLRSIIAEAKPDYIINAAAYTNVEKAEDEETIAQKINGDALAVLAEEAKKIGSGLLHYSTDYVFDGQKNEAYLETDTVNPLNAYGRSKLSGEQKLQEVGGRFLILRVSWVYSNFGTNFFKKMCKLGHENKELQVVDDQWGAPTWARDIADVSAQLCAKGFQAPDSGVYHLSPQGKASWCEFAKTIFAEIKTQGLASDLVVQTVTPVKTSAFAAKAKRPANSVLNSQKILNKFGISLPHWEDSLVKVIEEYGRLR